MQPRITSIYFLTSSIQFQMFAFIINIGILLIDSIYQNSYFSLLE